MGSELSMAARAEGTSKYTKAYARALKKDRGAVLHKVVWVAGWSVAGQRPAPTEARGRAEFGRGPAGGRRAS